MPNWARKMVTYTTAECTFGTFWHFKFPTQVIRPPHEAF